MTDEKHTLLSNAPLLIAGAVLVVAACVWFVSWMAPEADAERSAGAKARTGDGLPPLRSLPPPGTDILPPLRSLPPEAPASKTAGAPSPSIVKPAASVADAAAPSPGTEAPAEPKTAPAHAAKRAEQAAADALRGRYVGSMGDAVGLTLVISAVEGGAVKGTASVTGGGACDDDYPVQGVARGGKLELRAPRMGGRAGDCPLSLSLTVSGHRLAGADGSGGSVQLTKR